MKAVVPLEASWNVDEGLTLRVKLNGKDHVFTGDVVVVERAEAVVQVSLKSVVDSLDQPVSYTPFTTPRG